MDVDLLRGIDPDRRHVRPARPRLPRDREAEALVEIQRALQIARDDDQWSMALTPITGSLLRSTRGGAAAADALALPLVERVGAERPPRRIVRLAQRVLDGAPCAVFRGFRQGAEQRGAAAGSHVREDTGGAELCDVVAVEEERRRTGRSASVTQERSAMSVYMFMPRVMCAKPVLRLMTRLSSSSRVSAAATSATTARTISAASATRRPFIGRPRRLVDLGVSRKSA